MAPGEHTQRRDTQHGFDLRNRYVFTGKLVMQTALHIGGGKATLSSSDSPVVLTPDQKPYIPGSSFKGALRSTVEKLAVNLPGFTSCALMELSKDQIEEERRRDEAMKGICPTIRQRNITDRKQAAMSPKELEDVTKETLDALCDTCHLFGSPFAAARVNVSDLYTREGAWSGVLQIRDGVAIDRDSEKAKDRLKYDFEVVPVGAAFDLQIGLENASKKDVQLLCVGLSEFVNGFGAIGGKRSRGLGMATLEGLQVAALELFTEGLHEAPVDKAERIRRLHQYLIRREFSRTFDDGREFLEAYINSIFE
jgi:CRISPR-associated RAMP protein (TIGR02581 family)